MGRHGSIGRLDDIQTAMKTLKKNRKKLEYIFSTITSPAGNSGNCIYDYAHSFFGEDFKSN